jgi:hypothetical protein
MPSNAITHYYNSSIKYTTCFCFERAILHLICFEALHGGSKNIGIQKIP